MPFNPNEYRREYNKSRYEQITLRLLKGERDRIQQAATEAGKTLNRFIYDTLLSVIDGQAPAQKQAKIEPPSMVYLRSLQNRQEEEEEEYLPLPWEE